MLRSTSKAVLASSLAFAPAVAAAQSNESAAPLSIASVRAAESTDGSRLSGDYGPLIAIGLLALVIAAANSDSP